MLSTIAPVSERDKPTKIARLAPYVDTIEASTPRWLHPNFLSCVRANCGTMKITVIRDRDNSEIVRRHLLKVNQPSRLCIELLERYKQHHDPKLSIYRVHPAFDVIEIYAGVTREEVIHVFKNLFHLRYRRGTDEIHDEEGSRYSVQVKGRKSRPYRNSIFYDEKPSKITGEIDAIHFEPRLERKRAVQAMEIEDPADILKIKPIGLFAKLIAIKDHRNILEKIAVRGIKLTCEENPNADRDHIERRIRAINSRLGLHHASIFARHHSKQFGRVRAWDCLDIEKDWNWASKDVGCRDDVGKMHCLLPRETSKPRIKRERLES